MHERHIEIKVGALVLVALVLFIGFVVALGDLRPGKRVTVYVDFPHSGDLKAGAPVKVAGVTAGKVARVELWGGRIDPKLHRPVQVRVRLGLKPDMAKIVRRDARFFISTLGVLGAKYIEVEPGTSKAPPIEPGEVFVGEPPMRLELVTRDLTTLLGHVSELVRENRPLVHELLQTALQTLQDADTLIRDNREALARVLGRLDESTERLNQLLASAQTAVGDGADVRATLEHVRATAAEVRRRVPAVFDRAESVAARVEEVATRAVELEKAVEQPVAELLDRLLRVAADVGQIVGKVLEGRGNVGAVLADVTLYTDLKALLADLRRHPWKLIWKE